MMMGIGLALVTLGAILRYAIESSGDEFDLPTVGLILMIVGGVAFLTGVGLEYMSRRAAIQRQPLPAPLPPAPPAGMPPASPPATPPYTGQPPYSGQPPASPPPTNPH